MARDPSDIVVRSEINVHVPRERAFSLFTNNFGDWWPSENTFARAMGDRDSLDTIVVEPEAGGHWYERSTSGEETSWGKVLVWEPPVRVKLGWQITAQGLPEPDANRASEVDVSFHDIGDSKSLVVIEHGAFDRHGRDDGAVWGEAMGSSEGWPKFLQHFKYFAES